MDENSVYRHNAEENTKKFAIPIDDYDKMKKVCFKVNTSCMRTKSMIWNTTTTELYHTQGLL